MLKVSEVMNRKFECIPRNTSIHEAAVQMRDLNVGMLPVEENQKIVGTITDRDITIRATANGTDPDKTTVGDIMSTEVITCMDSDDIQEAARIMEDHQVRRLMIQDSGGDYIGMLALADVARNHDAEQISAEILEGVSQPGQAAAAAM